MAVLINTTKCGISEEENIGMGSLTAGSRKGKKGQSGRRKEFNYGKQPEGFHTKGKKNKVKKDEFNYVEQPDGWGSRKGEEGQSGRRMNLIKWKSSLKAGVKGEEEQSGKKDSLI